MKRSILLPLILITAVLPALSQATFGVGEMQHYLLDYIRPTANGLASAMGVGWIHGVKTHDTGSFGVSADAMLISTPKSMLDMESSSVADMCSDDGFQFLAGEERVDVTSSNFDLPTLGSENATNLKLTYKLDAGGTSRLEVPVMDGQGVRSTTNYVLQAYVGLPKKTDLLVRVLPAAGPIVNRPSRGIEVSKINTWGIGVKHDLMQWISPANSETEKSSLFNVSALLAYSLFNYEMASTAFSYRPDDFSVRHIVDGDIAVQDTRDASVYGTQGYDLHMSSLVGSLLIGIDMPEIQPFIGIGFNKAVVTTGFLGKYPIVEESLADVSGRTVEVVGVESLSSSSENMTFMNLQAGFNMSLEKFSINLQYSYQQYSTISAGVSYVIK